jgi:hypothetical protein
VTARATLRDPTPPNRATVRLLSGVIVGVVRNPKRKVSKKGAPAIYKYNYSWYYTLLKVEACCPIY